MSQEDTNAHQHSKKMPVKKTNWLKYIVLTVIVLLCVAGFYAYVKYTEIYPSTDDAYVNGHTVHIAAQVTGKLDKLYIENNQKVQKGQLLFTIAPDSFIYAVQKAKADLDLAQKQIAAIEDQIAAKKAKLKEYEAKLFVAQQKYNRISKLVEQGMSSKEEGDESQGDLEVAKATINAAKADIAQEQKQLVLQQATIAAQKAQLETAKLNLSYTKVYAPLSGYISDFSLRQGALINENQNLFTLVSDEGYWIDANYKETQMARIKPGQRADIVLDMYPDITLKGKVQSISEGSGSVFSLLPPENASGNWVKVIQRFPVKVVLLPGEIKKVPRLRVGASATVTVNTHTS
ncbi:HlyD family secretion protein [Facilibium subflavum]|uniref:HlyD family secretion protein n=1 Tax=Facilibium subflavum TaxID=2219058 RepID=UPI000E65A6E0|nr:HlyD family secretion protein [Facilibium subflavum]